MIDSGEEYSTAGYIFLCSLSYTGLKPMMHRMNQSRINSGQNCSATRSRSKSNAKRQRTVGSHNHNCDDRDRPRPCIMAADASSLFGGPPPQGDD
eukprot:scaffold13705_cov44-Attheya_sp.AAC.2